MANHLRPGLLIHLVPPHLASYLVEVVKVFLGMAWLQYGLCSTMKKVNEAKSKAGSASATNLKCQGAEMHASRVLSLFFSRSWHCSLQACFLNCCSWCPQTALKSECGLLYTWLVPEMVFTHLPCTKLMQAKSQLTPGVHSHILEGAHWAQASAHKHQELQLPVTKLTQWTLVGAWLSNHDNPLPMTPLAQKPTSKSRSMLSCAHSQGWTRSWPSLTYWLSFSCQASHPCHELKTSHSPIWSKTWAHNWIIKIPAVEWMPSNTCSNTCCYKLLLDWHLVQLLISTATSSWRWRRAGAGRWAPAPLLGMLLLLPS